MAVVAGTAERFISFYPVSVVNYLWGYSMSVARWFGLVGAVMEYDGLGRGMVRPCCRPAELAQLYVIVEMGGLL